MCYSRPVAGSLRFLLVLHGSDRLADSIVYRHTYVLILSFSDSVYAVSYVHDLVSILAQHVD